MSSQPEMLLGDIHVTSPYTRAILSIDAHILLCSSNIMISTMLPQYKDLHKIDIAGSHSMRISQ